jgi:hypothetical protein
MPTSQHPATAMPPAQQSAGPGMMGTFASSAAGSMAGSMIGHSLFGGRGGEAPAPALESARAAAPPSGLVCDFENKQFLQCMSNTQDNFEQCTAFFDMFKQCNAQAH